MSESSASPPQREATSLRMLGRFFVMLGALVLLATCWTLDNFRASVVNICSGCTLAIVGAVMISISRRLFAGVAKARESGAD
jgi:hypothetical protein